MTVLRKPATWWFRYARVAASRTGCIIGYGCAPTPVASQELVTEAIAAGPHDPCFTRAIALDPSDDLNCGVAWPAREEHVVLQTRVPGGDWKPFGGSPKGFFSLGGPACVLGNCPPSLSIAHYKGPIAKTEGVHS